MTRTTLNRLPISNTWSQLFLDHQHPPLGIAARRLIPPGDIIDSVIGVVLSAPNSSIQSSATLSRRGKRTGNTTF